MDVFVLETKIPSNCLSTRRLSAEIESFVGYLALEVSSKKCFQYVDQHFIWLNFNTFRETSAS